MTSMRRSRITRSLLVTAALVALPISGLAQDAPRGTLRIGFESGIQHLDPALAYDQVGVPLMHSMFDTLVTYDENLRLVPSLAAAMPTISADGLVYTFTLRPGVQFVQGGNALREVTAADVVASLNRLLSPDLKPNPSPVGGAFFAGIEGAADVLAGTTKEASGLVAVDDHTVQITLSHPDRTFLNVLAMTFGSVVPKELATLDGAFDQAPVGSGPFWLDSYKADEKIVLQRNPVYWNEGYPKSDTIEGYLLVTGENQVQMVQAGDLDLTGEPTIPSADYTALKNDPTWADRIVSTPAVALNYLMMDTSGPESPFADVRVRQAVNHVVDKQNLIRLANGLGEAVDCIFPPRMPGFDDTCHPYPMDLDAAKQLMSDAGLSAGFDTKLYTDTTTLSGDQAQSIATDLAQIGIRVQVVPQDFDVLLGSVQTPHTAPLVWLGWFQDYPDPSDFIDPILSCASAVQGGSNWAWYCDPAIDARAAAARKEPSLDVAIPEYQSIEKAIMDQAPWVPGYSPVFTALHSEKLTGFDQFNGVYFFDLPSYSVQP